MSTIPDRYNFWSLQVGESVVGLWNLSKEPSQFWLFVIVLIVMSVELPIPHFYFFVLFFGLFVCIVLSVVVAAAVVAAAVVAPPPHPLLSYWFIVGWLAHHRIAWLRTNVLLRFTHTATESGTKSSNEKGPCRDSGLTSGLETKLSRQIHSDRARNKSRGQLKQQWSLRPDGHVICTNIIRLTTSSPKEGSTEQYWISVHCQDTASRASSEWGSYICRV